MFLDDMMIGIITPYSGPYSTAMKKKNITETSKQTNKKKECEKMFAQLEKKELSHFMKTPEISKAAMTNIKPRFHV